MTQKTKPKKTPDGKSNPITPIRLTPADHRKINQILRAKTHLQTIADAVRFAIHEVEV